MKKAIFKIIIGAIELAFVLMGLVFMFLTYKFSSVILSSHSVKGIDYKSIVDDVVANNNLYIITFTFIGIILTVNQIKQSIKSNEINEKTEWLNKLKEVLKNNNLKEENLTLFNFFDLYGPNLFKYSYFFDLTIGNCLIVRFFFFRFLTKDYLNSFEKFAREKRASYDSTKIHSFKDFNNVIHYVLKPKVRYKPKFDKLTKKLYEEKTLKAIKKYEKKNEN